AEHGHPVPERPRSDRPSGTLTFHGEPVLSRRSDAALRAIARETGGAFVPLGLATSALGRLYRSRIGPAAQARRAVARAPEPAGRFGVFLLLGLGFGLAAGRPVWRARVPARAGVLGAALTALALAAALGAAPQPDPTAPGASAPALVAAGRAAYARGRF